MYEDRVRYIWEDPLDGFDTYAYCKQRGINFLSYASQAINFKRSFSNENGNFIDLDGKEINTTDRYDFEDIWKAGYRSYQAISIAFDGKHLKNNEVSFVLVSLLESLLSAEIVSFRDEDGEAISKQEIMNSSYIYEIFSDYVKKYWPMTTNEVVKSHFEIALNMFILIAIDSIFIAWNLHSWAGDEFGIFSKLVGTLKELQATDKAKKQKASNAAKARHEETELIRLYVLDYYHKHQEEYKSLRAASFELTKVAPVTQRTIYDWLRRNIQR